MPLLHISLAANVTTVELQQEIQAQHMRLRTVYASFGGANATRMDGVLVDFGGDFLGNTREVNSSTAASATIGGHSYLALPRPGIMQGSGTAILGRHPCPPFCQDMNLGFDTVTIPRSFTVTVYDDNAAKGLADFSDTGAHRIDMYFEYQSNDDTHTV